MWSYVIVIIVVAAAASYAAWRAWRAWTGKGGCSCGRGDRCPMQDSREDQDKTSK